MNGASIAWMFCATLLVACPSRSGLETLPALTTDNGQAEQALNEANAAADRGEPTAARERYELFLRMYPTDPLVPIAQLGLGRIELAEGRAAEAQSRFREVAQHPDASVAERGRFYDGIAAHFLGEHRYAIHALSPYVGRTIDPEETVMLLRTLAAASIATGDRLAAMRALDVLTRASVPEEQRATARVELRTLVTGAATTAELDHYYAGLARDGNAWPEIARRIVRLAYDAGDLDRVREVLADLAAANIELDAEIAELALRIERTEQADRNVIGAILPLTGRAREVGQATLQGLLLAAGAPANGPPPPGSAQLAFRDDASDPERAIRAVDDLVSLHRVIAIIGPIDSVSATAAAERAQELGVPMIAITPSHQVVEQGRMIFRWFTSPGAETRDLVRAAARRGARRYAILYPENAFGNTLRQLFEAQVREQAATVVAAVGYAPNATSFGTETSRLEAERPDAILIADSHRALSLIAPALAAAGFQSRGEEVTIAAPNARPVSILVPSVGYDPELITRSGRYLQGALFASSFFPAIESSEERDFVLAYQTRFQALPTIYSAYAYDAFRVIRSHALSGVETREEMANALIGGPRIPTVTGSGGFDPSRQPSRATRIWELDGATLDARALPSE